MIFQCVQLYVLILPLQCSPMAIVRYKRKADERQRSLRLEVINDNVSKHEFVRDIVLCGVAC